MMARRAARQKNQLPASYYEGYLEKRSFKDKTSRKLWTCLCGNTLFFFNDKKDIDYVEKLDLSELISVLDDSSQDRNLDAARLNLQMKDGNIKFTVPSAEARELWKGFINAVTKLSVPATLNLLPGHIHMLKEAVEKEKERIKTVSSAATNSDPYVALEADKPACYHNVSRLESEILLSKETERGNLLLRPDGGGKGFAISTRQVLDKPVFKHYRVTRKLEGGFVIDVDNPVLCATLHDVVNYLVEKTGGVFIPLILEDQYEKNISYIQSDKENGEKSVYQAPSNPTPPSVPPKPAPRIPSFEPMPIEEEPLYLYMNDDLEEKEDKTEDPIPIPPTQPESAPKKALMPPVPAVRRSSSSASLSPSNPSVSQEVKGIENAENLGQKPEESAPKETIMPPVPAPRRSSSSASQSSKPLVGREVKGNAHAENLGQMISELTVLFEHRARCQ